MVKLEDNRDFVANWTSGFDAFKKRVMGEDDDDTLIGGGGADSLLGGTGNDFLRSVFSEGEDQTAITRGETESSFEHLAELDAAMAGEQVTAVSSVLTWDGPDGGQWHAPSWTGGRPGDVPDETCKDVLAAADFFTVEVWGLRGLVTFYVFFVIELETRKIEIVGITPGPDEAWMVQVGRNLTDPIDLPLDVFRERERAKVGSGKFFVAVPEHLPKRVVRQHRLMEDPEETAASLHDKLAQLGARALREAQDRRPQPVAQDPLHLVIIGGSLGAQALNETVPAALAQLDPAQRPEVRHQAGRGKAAETDEAYRAHAVIAEVSEFVDDMAAAYAWADLVVCRAGALTVAELCAVGLPALFIPYPAAVDDHQTRNAEYLVENDAALLLQQSQTDARKLANVLSSLAGDRARLASMATRGRAAAVPDAADRVAALCREYVS